MSRVNSKFYYNLVISHASQVTRKGKVINKAKICDIMIIIFYLKEKILYFC